MKIYRPIKTNRKTQAFGDNLSCAKVSPVGEPLTPFQIVSTPTTNVCPVGYKPFYPLIGMKGHNGEDWQAYHGEPIFFPVDVPGIDWQASTEVDESGGIGIRVRSVQPVPLDHLPPQAVGSLNMIKTQWNKLGGAVRLQFLFWHLQKVDVYDKKPIKLGDRIGWADSTGASSGDHLHFSMKVSDENSWYTIDGDNGYTGAIDFDDWYDNQFILDVLTAQQLPALSPADAVAVIAAQKQAEGNNKLAAILWAIVALIKAFLTGNK